jgi:hypothetical protein
LHIRGKAVILLHEILMEEDIIMSTTVKAYCNGSAFAPMTPLDIQPEKAFAQDGSPVRDTAKKAVAFKKITANLHAMNVTEPLSAEFDGILSQRTRFNTEINK